MDSEVSAHIGVLALQGDVREHLQAVAAAGGTGHLVTRPAHLHGLDGLIIPGGESTTIGRLMAVYELDQAIPEQARAGMALFGTCAGLILLATDIVGSDQPRLGLLGARILRNAYGRQIDSFETTLRSAALGPDPVPAVFIRAPVVEAVDEGVQVLAEHGGHSVLVRSGAVLGATFHPELTGDHRIHRYFLDMARRGA